MTIAIDATPLSVPTGGVARYTWELSRALAERFPSDLYWLISDQPIPAVENLPDNLKIRTAPHSKWWSIGLAREMGRLHADLFHGVDFSVPYFPLRPAVMTVHDLSPWLDAEWQPGADRIRSRTPKLLRFGAATMVITPSEAIRRAAIDQFALAPSRVVAIPLAAASHFRPVETIKPTRPYLLFVGTLEPRKNVDRIVEAWREVKRTHEVDLVLAGRVREDFHPPAAEPGLSLRGAIAEQELPALYSGAAACVYPSLYEGFGLPVLEAMQCGALVITSLDPAIQEVAQDAALSVDARDVRGLATAMRTALDNGEIVRSLRKKGIERANQYSWRRTAELTREVYDDAVRAFAS